MWLVVHTLLARSFYVYITFYSGPTCTWEDIASPVNTRVAVIFCSGKGRPAAPVLKELDANKDFAFLLSRLVHHVWFGCYTLTSNLNFSLKTLATLLVISLIKYIHCELFFPHFHICEILWFTLWRRFVAAVSSLPELEKDCMGKDRTGRTTTKNCKCK